MKVSQLAIVTNHVNRLSKLKRALDDFSYRPIKVESLSYDITDLTSISECREAIIPILRGYIAETRRDLANYGVEDDEK